MGTNCCEIVENMTDSKDRHFHSLEGEMRPCPKCGRQLNLADAARNDWDLTCPCGAQLTVYREEVGDETCSWFEVDVPAKAECHLPKPSTS